MSSGMNFHILTLFPDMVLPGLSESILGRAVQSGRISVEAVNIRDYTQNKHKKVDDYPYGGGAGMLMQAQPVYDACQAVEERIRTRRPEAGRPRVIYVTPQGQVFSQAMAEELAKEEDLIFLCGHYEGIDERALASVVTDYVSIGDYVLTGGELPAMVMIDCISRLVPGVLKNEESAEFESFHDNLLEYPQYSRPKIWRGMEVPGVLLSGDHAKVEAWRLEQSRERTRLRRPDLYERATRKQRALNYLMKNKLAHADMLEVLSRDQARLLHADENGVLLFDEPSGAWMASAADEDMGERLLSLVPREEKELLFSVHQDFLRDSISRRFGRNYVSACTQFVYTRKRPPEKTPGMQEYEIRPLTAEAAEEVYAGYPHHDIYSLEDIQERIGAGALFGAFVEGGLAGFAGFHREGGMGMLEVLPQYRRRGIGEALEQYLIRFFLERGWTPFCQVFLGNEPSEALQKKLGLRRAQGRVYWIS